MKLFRMWSEQPQSSVVGYEKIQWWRYRSSPLIVDDHLVQGFTTFGSWRQAAIVATLGKYFKEEEVSNFKIYIENIIPEAEVHLEALKIPLDERSLHQLRTESGLTPSGPFLRGSPYLRSAEIYGTVVNDGGDNHYLPAI